MNEFLVLNRLAYSKLKKNKIYLIKFYIFFAGRKFLNFKIKK
jgi:hypothetical protein